MTYAAFDLSLQGGNPVELYQFVQGLNRWNFTTSESQYVYQTTPYAPSSLKRDRIKQSTDIQKDGIKLTFARDDVFASQFIGAAPDDVTTVTILRGHRNDPDQEFQAYWKGRVLSASTSDSKITITCESIFTAIRRPGLRAHYELSCRHILYGPRCTVNREAFKTTGTVLSGGTGLVIPVAGAELKPNGWFSNGLLVVPATNTTRFVLAHTGNSLTLSRPLNSPSGTVVSLYPGCDHLTATCEGKFNNLDNHGGFPFIPIKNPFGGNSIV